MDARERWFDEQEAAWLYAIVAQHEPDPTMQQLFLALAVAARGQAAILATDVTDAGTHPLTYVPTRRARVVAALVRRLGPRRVRGVLAAMKVRGLAAYNTVGGLTTHAMPNSVGEVGARHRGTGGNTLRAAVFGINDGLVSNTSLMMGVAGASAGQQPMILMSGVAGLLAGAFSMAAGEYISVRSQRELYEHQIAQERDELERYPNEEAEELALIYGARGVPIEQARALAHSMLQNKEQTLNTLVREELGLNPDDLGSPWGAAGASFVAFATGAALPLVPFIIGMGPSSLTVTLIISVGALFAVGATMSLFSGRGALVGGARMLLVGTAAAGATFMLGRLFGASPG